MEACDSAKPAKWLPDSPDSEDFFILLVRAFRLDNVGSLHSLVACNDVGPWCLHGPSMAHRREGARLPLPFFGVLRVFLGGLGGGHSEAHRTEFVDVDPVDDDWEPRVVLISSAPVFATSFNICIPVR